MEIEPRSATFGLGMETEPPALDLATMQQAAQPAVEPVLQSDSRLVAADAASLPLRQQEGVGPFGTFAEPVPQTTRCVIPGSTAEEQPAAPARPEPRPESSAAIAHPEPSACLHTITVDAGSRGSGPSFGEFFGTVSSALGLQSGGAFCAWTSLAPAQLDSERSQASLGHVLCAFVCFVLTNASFAVAPWAQHGAVDAAAQVPEPSGPLFRQLQALGSELLRVEVPAAANSSVAFALGTLRKWATCTTVSGERRLT